VLPAFQLFLLAQVAAVVMAAAAVAAVLGIRTTTLLRPEILIPWWLERAEYALQHLE
jgi:uncharacterized membrane protein